MTRKSTQTKPFRFSTMFLLLEDRCVPASTITILDNGAGTLDGFLSATDGTIGLTDGGAAAGSVSRAALQSVNSNTDIIIAAQTSIVVSNLTSPLALQTGTGKIAVFAVNSGTFSFIDQTDLISTAGGAINFTASTSASLGALNSGGGNIQVTSNDIALQAAINAGSGVVTMQPSTASRDIDVGTETAGKLSLTDPELDRVTAGVLRIGVNAGSIDIAVTAAITLASSVSTLSLISAGTISDTGTGSVSVGNLRATATTGVTLDAAANEVSTLAGNVTAAGGDFIYRDATGFNIGTVDGFVGIKTVSTGDLISLTAGGAVTQIAGADLNSSFLELLGTGSFTLNNSGNDVIAIAAKLTSSVTGTLSYTDADPVNIGNAGGTSGIVTFNSSVIITSGGNMTVFDNLVGADVNAGAATVSLAASIILDIRANAGITGTGGVTLIGGNILIAAPVNAGTSTASLRPFSKFSQINLGGADGGSGLGLLDSELDLVTAGIISIGTPTGGSINVSASVDPANCSQLELFTGGSITDTGGSVVAVAKFGMTAAAGIGTSAAKVVTSANNLEAQTVTGGIFISEINGVAIGGVSAALSGLRVVTSGNIELSTDSGGIDLADTTGFAVLQGGFKSGDVTLAANGLSSNITTTVISDAISASGGNIILIAGQDIFLGQSANFDNDLNANNNIALLAGRDILIDGDSDLNADSGEKNTGGSISLSAGRNITLGNTFGSDSTIRAGGGGGGGVTLALGAGGLLSILATTGGGIASDSGSITITADRLNNPASSSGIHAPAPGKNVRIQPFSTDRAIDLGSATDAAAGTLELSDAELDNIETSLLRIGNTVLAGNISISKAITVAGGAVLSLFSSGTITDAVAGSLIVTSLQVTAASGVTLGSADNDIFVLAGRVIAAGAGFGYRDATGFDIGTVDGVGGIATDTTNTASRITLTAGGAVTQSLGSFITRELELLGTGSFTLTNPTNDVDVLAVNLTTANTGTLNYADMDSLAIGSAGGTNGITTKSGNVTVQSGSSFPGDLQVLDTRPGTDIVAVSGKVVLIAGSIGSTDSQLTINANTGIGGSSVTLQADKMDIAAQVIGATSAALIPFQPGTPIDLGLGLATGALGLSDAELDLVITPTMVIGDNSSGAMSLSANITRPMSTKVQLFSGSGIVPFFTGGSIDTGGGTLLVSPGTLYSPSTQGNDVTASVVSFASGSDLLIDIQGSTVDFQFFQLNVSGALNLSSVDLVLTGAYIPLNTDVFTIVSATNITGTFNGLPDGATRLFGGKALQINYTPTAVTLTVTAVNVPENHFSIGRDAGASASVTLFNADATPRFTLTPFGATFTGGIRAAAGDFTNDGVADLVVASGPGRPGEVRIFNGVTQQPIPTPLPNNQPFGNTFTRGILVACGDMNADGISDLIITAEAGGGARVRVFQSTGAGFTQRSDFIALIGGDGVPDGKIFRGGSRAAVSDINGDGFGDLIWAAGAGGGPRIATFNGKLIDNGSNVAFKLTGDFFALSSALRDGAFIAGGDVTGDGIGDLIAGGGSGAPPQVVGFSGTTLMVNNFSKFLDFTSGNPNTRQGIRVAVKDLDSDTFADLIVGSAPTAGSHVSAFAGKNLAGSTTGAPILDFDAFPGFIGGVFVG